MNCINKNHPDVKRLAGQLGKSNSFTAAAIAVWQDENSTEDFPDMATLKSFMNSDVQKNVKANSIRKITLSQNIVSSLVQKIQSALPGVDVRMVASGPEGVIASRKGGTIFLNLDRITPDAPLHEFGHIWLDVLENIDEKEFSKIETEVNRLIAEENSFAIKVKNMYPELSGRRLVKEIASMGLGFRSMNAVEQWAKSHNVESKTFSGRFFDAIDKIMNSLKKAVFYFFQNQKEPTFDFSLTNTLDDIFDNVTADVLEGNNVFVDYNTHQDLMDYVNEEDIDFLKKEQQNEVFGNINDFKSGIATSRNTVLTNSTKTDAQIKQEIRHSITQNKKREYWYYGHGLKEMDMDKEMLIEKVLLKYKKLNVNYKNKVKDFLTRIISGDPKEVAAMNSGFGDMAASALDKFVDSFYLNGNAEKVMLYSELRTDPNLSRFYKDELVGDDFVVIVHKSKPGDMEISIFDVTMEGLTSGSEIFSNRKNIYRKYITDMKAHSLGTTYNNNDGSVMLLSALFAAKHAMIESGKGNNDLKIRNVGVISQKKFDIDKRYAHDVKYDINKNIDTISQIPALLEALTPTMKNIVEAKVSQRTVSSDIEKLVHFYESKSADESLVAITPEMIEILKTGSVNDKKEIFRRRMSLIESSKVAMTKAMSDEKRLLALSDIGVYLSGLSDRNEISDMSGMATLFQTPFSFQSDVLQAVHKETVIANNMIVNESMKWQAISSKFSSAIIEKRKTLARTSLVADQGSKMFQHLYKKTKAIDAEGNETEIYIPGLMHTAKRIGGTEENPVWAFADKETERLYKSGELDKTDLLYTEAIANMVEEMYAKSIFEKHKYLDEKYTIEKAKEKLYEKGFQWGMIPIIDKTGTELFWEGKIQSAAKRSLDAISNINNIFDEMLADAGLMNKLGDLFESQITFTGRLDISGLKLTEDGKYFISNKKLYENTGFNAERAAMSFNLAQNRTMIYRDRLLPVVNSANTMLNIYTEMGKDVENTKKAMDNFIDRVVYMRVKPTKEGGMVNIAKVVDSSSAVLTFAHIFGRISLFWKSTVWNNIQMHMTALANTVASNGHFNVKHLYKGFEQSFTEFDKMKKMLRHFNIIDRSEFDLLENPRLMKSDKSVLQQFWGFYANYISDMHARGVTMIAEMVKQGTWDAYSIDKDGNVAYDETKDPRMYKDGRITDAGKILKRSIKEDLVSQGLMREDEDKLTRGHDITDANNYKYLSDKYVVGAYDNVAKSLATQHWATRTASKFRIFSVSRLENLGLFMADRKTSMGQERKVVMDEDGKPMVIRDVIEMEGYLQSLGRCLGIMKNLTTKPNKREYWESIPPVTKNNLVRIMLEGVIFTSLYLAVNGLASAGDSEEEKKERKMRKYRLSWIYSDVLSFSLAADIWNNPFPFIDASTRFVVGVFKTVNDRELNKETLSLLPGYGLAKDVNLIYETVTPNTEEQL